MTVFASTTGLPLEIKQYLDQLEIFIGEIDGKETVISSDDGNTCIDDGTIDAEDACVAFNEIVYFLWRTIPTQQPAQHTLEKNARPTGEVK